MEKTLTISLLLTAVLLFSLTACSGDNQFQGGEKSLANITLTE